MITPDRTLGEIAAEIPAASRVFREVGLDYCCGGRRPLGEACAERGIDPETILSAIRHQPADTEESWEGRPLAALIQHILQRYHEPLRAELPELMEMARTVEEKHAENAVCPHGLARHLENIYEAVLSHLAKEEQILFPIIVSGMGGQAQGPIQVMETEHDDHGANLAITRRLTHDFSAPEEACPTWKALYLRLAQLEADLMDHIHLENSVLFPRALCE